MAHGFLRRLFEVFERFKTAVDVVTTSEVSVSVTVDDTAARSTTIVDQPAEFAEVACRGGNGDRLRGRRGSARGSDAVRPGGRRRSDRFRCGMVSQAASRRNITFVLRDADVADAMTRFHEAFFPLTDAWRVVLVLADAAACMVPRSIAHALLLVGHGQMGRMVESLAPRVRLRGRPASSIRSRRRTRRTRRRTGGAAVDVAIDFSSPDAVTTKCRSLARRGINVVIGTTGWQTRGRAARRDCRRGHRHRGRRRIFRPASSCSKRSWRGRRRCSPPAGVRRVAARSASRGQEGRAVGHRAAAEAGDGEGRLSRGRSMCRRRAPGTFPACTRSASTAPPNRSR